MNSRRATASGIAATSPSPASSSRRMYTASNSALGGSSTADDARAAQERANAAQVAIHEEKMEERRKKKLEEKMARYQFLIGNTLGKGDGLTIQEVRQMQDERHSEMTAAATLKLRDTQIQDECNKFPLESRQEPGKGVEDTAKTMREIRLQQQAAYTSMHKKPSS